MFRYGWQNKKPRHTKRNKKNCECSMRKNRIFMKISKHRNNDLGDNSITIIMQQSEQYSQHDNTNSKPTDGIIE